MGQSKKKWNAAMGCQVVTGRKLNLPTGHSLLQSVMVDGTPYFDNDTQLMLDYVADGEETYVLVRKKTPNSSEWGKPKKWALSAIQDRTAADLANYAKRLEIKQPPGAILANLIQDKFKQISKQA